MRNRLAPQPCVALKNWEGSLHCGGPQKEQSDSAPHQAPQPGASVPGIIAPTTPGCKNQQRHGDGGQLETHDSPVGSGRGMAT